MDRKPRTGTKVKISSFLLILATALLMLPSLAGAYTYWYVTKASSPSSLSGHITPPSGAGYEASGTRTNITSPEITFAEFTVETPPGYAISAVKVDNLATTPLAGTNIYRVNKGSKTSHTIVAYYAAASYTITTYPAPGGYIAPSAVVSGGGKSFAIIPNNGYRISSVIVDGEADTTPEDGPLAEVLANGSFTFTTINANHTLTATFSIVPQLTAIISTPDQLRPIANASLTVDGSGSFANVAATYAWSVSPATGFILTPAADGKSAAFAATAIGTYTVSLTLSAPGAANSSDTLTLEVISNVEYATRACATCHEPRNPGLVDAFLSSHHANNDISCQVCHLQSGGHYAMATAAVCAGCHTPLPHGEGLADCLICHDPHSATVGGDVGCNLCHGYPPASGAHAAHFGLTETSGSYADLKTLEERYPTATIDTAPTVYAFGCAICHTVDRTRHMNGVVDVLLYEEAAEAGSLKARAASTATYDPYTGTCSGVYCHSSGQAAPTYQTTPAWTSGEKLSCDGCHGNPPAYSSGAAGSATANSHIGLAIDGWTWGHFSGIRGPWHTPQHGTPYPESPSLANDDSAPITCQTCHYETTDPANVGPNGFYWLDTTGNYQYPGMVDPGSEASFLCGTCHNADNPDSPAVGTGKVLPLRHVNGKRDVKFDPRETLPADIAWLPADPNKPTRPMWFTGAGSSSWMPTTWPTDDAPVTMNGATRSWSLSAATYNPATKTCSNTSCHLEDLTPVWGKPLDAWNCTPCHSF